MQALGKGDADFWNPMIFGACLRMPGATNTIGVARLLVVLL